jgi:excisionase family DNA binding protein
MTEALPELIDIDTLALRLGDSVRHIRRLVAERRIPYLKVGHFVRFDPDEIAVWLDTQRVSVTGISRRTVEAQGEREVSSVSGSGTSSWD